MIERYWIKLKKHGLARFVGHLDAQRMLERAFRRARIPLAYSQGMSPRPYISLAIPLPVGYESEADYVDIRLAENVLPGDLTSALQGALPEGFAVLQATPVSRAMPALMARAVLADYALYGLAEDRLRMAYTAEHAMSLDELWLETADKRVNVRPRIGALAAVADGHMEARLSVGQQGTLRPDDLCRLIGLSEPARIVRTRILVDADGRLLTPEGWAKESRQGDME